MPVSEIIMIKPAAFGYNVETEGSNVFQSSSTLSAQQIAERAKEEFDAMIETLQQNGITVHCIEDSPKPSKPDAVFPNNWFSIHGNILVLYPMMSPIRRLERDPEVIRSLQLKFGIENTIDLRHFENEGKFLEGTGSLVFDEQHKVVYASLSPRTHPDLVKLLAEKLNYKVVAFSSSAQGKEVYHTNVVMSIAEQFVVVCFECITQGADELKRNISGSGKEIVEISLQQMQNFCGNCFEVKNDKGENILVMSLRAFDSFSNDQRKIIEKHARIVAISLPTIETVGGGSARCMMAGIVR